MRARVCMLCDWVSTHIGLLTQRRFILRVASLTKGEHYAAHLALILDLQREGRVWTFKIEQWATQRQNHRKFSISLWILPACSRSLSTRSRSLTLCARPCQSEVCTLTFILRLVRFVAGGPAALAFNHFNISLGQEQHLRSPYHRTSKWRSLWAGVCPT